MKNMFSARFVQFKVKFVPVVGNFKLGIFQTVTTWEIFKAYLRFPCKGGLK